jgi:hypothetical protein
MRKKEDAPNTKAQEQEMFQIGWVLHENVKCQSSNAKSNPKFKYYEFSF